MGAAKQDWTIWVRQPHPFPAETTYGQSSVDDAIATVFGPIEVTYQTPSNEYHVVTVLAVTRATAHQIAQAIHTLHMQRMHETRYYPFQGLCSVDIREGIDERSIPEWVHTLDNARQQHRGNEPAFRFVPALPNPVGTPLTQEIVGYLFNDQVVCGWCVFSDMGLLEYSARKDELKEKAIWDTDEHLSKLFCSYCHHPLYAIVSGKRRSLPYKDVGAFVQHNGVCYIPRLDGDNHHRVRRYRAIDFVRLAQGDEFMAASLFVRCTQEIPEQL